MVGKPVVSMKHARHGESIVCQGGCSRCETVSLACCVCGVHCLLRRVVYVVCDGGLRLNSNDQRCWRACGSEFCPSLQRDLK